MKLGVMVATVAAHGDTSPRRNRGHLWSLKSPRLIRFSNQSWLPTQLNNMGLSALARLEVKLSDNLDVSRGSRASVNHPEARA